MFTKKGKIKLHTGKEITPLKIGDYVHSVDFADNGVIVGFEADGMIRAKMDKDGEVRAFYWHEEIK